MQLLNYYQPPIPAMGTGSQYCLRWNNHRTNLLSAFESLLRQEAFTDVTLACEEGVTLHAHRLVLAACSTYFSTLFENAHSTQHPIVVLKDVKGEDMKALLAYMYRGEVNVEQSALEGLLKVAEGLKVKGLVEDLAKDTGPIPLLTHSSHIREIKNDVGVSSPTITPGDQRVTSSAPEKRESEVPYPVPSRPPPLGSPPPLTIPVPPITSRASPKRGFDSPSREPPYHHNSYHLSPSRPFMIQSYYNRLHPHSLDQRIPPNLLEIRDPSAVLETQDRIAKLERPSRPASGDARIDRRPSPLPLLTNFSPHTIGNESPPTKRSRPPQFLGGEPPLISPTPILRTALAPFNPDVSSLVSLASSMMPLSPLLSTRPSPSIIPKDLTARGPPHPHDIRDQIEQPPSYRMTPVKKKESLSDDESRHDIKEEPLENERAANIPILGDFSSFPLDPTQIPSSHYNNIVSYVPTPKPEWKRYKQYTKADLMEAIEEVKSGVTALQASRKYKVPSRTLYDKIKKMGISTIPRRIPGMKKNLGELEGNSLEPPTMDQRPHSAGAFEHISSSRDFYDQRPCSMEAQNGGSLSQPLHSSSDSESSKMDTRKGGRDSPPPPSHVEPPHQGTSTVGSFSLVGRKMFSAGESSPLDLTEHDSLIHGRQQLEERA